MYIKLTTPERLKDLRVERGLTLEQLSEATGISRAALGKYETDDVKDISPFSITALAEFYGVSSDYLLGLTETKNHSNADLHNLHLSDAMIDILKSGKLNNRLLCELVTHKSFRRFLVDAEIYIDRIADMRINDLNVVLNAARQTIIEKQSLDENDLYVRTLELAQVDEDEYFSHAVNKDMGQILRDIRDAHRTDTITADEVSPAAEAQKKLQEAMNYEGSEQEKQARVFCAQLGINYDKLTTEEFVALIDILKKSKHLKSPYNQRGKGNIARSKGKGK